MSNFEHGHGNVIVIGDQDIERLVSLARRDPQHKYRFCANPDAAAPIHEMLIVHTDETVVPIHKHKGKSESFHFIKGYADVLLYSDDGQLTDTINMGPFGSMGRAVYYRLNADIYHTLRILSPVIVLHEVTNGPWKKEDMLIAPWWKPPEGWTR